MTIDSDALRKRAARARERAESAYQASEYPRLGRAAYTDLADRLEKLADVVDATGEDLGLLGSDRDSRRRRRIARLKLKAARLAVDAAQTACESHDIGSRIPFGQPILVGHHSEKGHRRTIARMEAKDRKRYELSQAARDAAYAAQAAERNTAIYSDDVHAIDKLERQAADLERKRDNFKALNASYRKVKGDLEKIDYAALGLSDGFRDRLAANREQFYMGSAKWRPIESYVFSNLSANLRRIRQRIVDLRKRDEATERPERRIGDVIVRDNLEFHKVELVFPGKPSDDVRRNLKAWGFRWIRSAGVWSRSIGTDTEARLEWLARLLDATQTT